MRVIKVLVFTEFVPTQDMLSRFLTERGFSVVSLNGSMGMGERERVQETFANDARILISTDAGGEGLNLQFSHVVVNYDIPWNPTLFFERPYPQASTDPDDALLEQGEADAKPSEQRPEQIGL